MAGGASLLLGLFTSASAGDGVDTHIIDGAYAALNYGSHTQMPIGHQHVLGVDVNCHGLFQFSLAGYSAGGVGSATLTLHKTGGSYSDNSQFFCKLLARTDWVEGEATWNRYKTGSNWTTAGGDVQAGVDTVETLLDIADDEIVFAVGPLVAAALSLGRTTLDVVVSSIQPNPVLPEYDQYTLVYTSDESTAALRPELDIEYAVMPDAGWIASRPRSHWKSVRTRAEWSAPDRRAHWEATR